MKDTKRDYKGEYSRLFPAKLSSSSFLTLYSLHLLQRYGAMYGMEILNHITDELGSDTWNPSHGTLYPLLQDMEKRGLIQSGKQDQSKKYYRITDLGKDELEKQLEGSKKALVDSYHFLRNVVKDLYDGEGSKDGKRV